MAVALGGNAESLANLAPGPRQQGLPTMELSLLRERISDILSRDLRGRMKAYGVRRDRARSAVTSPHRNVVLVTRGRDEYALSEVRVMPSPAGASLGSRWL